MTILGDELLKGEHVFLSAVTLADLPQFAEWFTADFEMLRLLGFTPAYPMPLPDHEAWFETIAQYDHNYAFSIRLLAENCLIGSIALMHLNWQARSAEVVIVIADAAMRHRGCGTDAMRIILRYGFMEFNLNRIQLRVFSYNPSAVAVYEKVGFVHEGTLRDSMLRDGTYFDTYIMSMLRREWEAQVNAK